jgi:hypothetical protein
MNDYDWDSDYNGNMDESFLEDWIEYDPEPLDEGVEEMLEGF